MQRPAVGPGRSRLGFMAGFTVLGAVLPGTSTLDTLVVIPATALSSFSLLIILNSLTLPLLALALPVPGRVLTAALPATPPAGPHPRTLEELS